MTTREAIALACICLGLLAMALQGPGGGPTPWAVPGAALALLGAWLAPGGGDAP